MINYRIERPDPLTTYTLEFIFDLLGVRSKQTSLPNCSLYYGDPATAPVAAGVVIPCVPSDIVWEGFRQGRINARSGRVFPFDVVNAVKQFLTDDVNLPYDAERCDGHQRLRFDASFQVRHGIASVPIVNAYVISLGEWLTEQLQVSRIAAWPPGRRCAIGLSHDVDRVARLSATLWWPPYARHLSRYENVVVARQRAWHIRQQIRHPFVDDIGVFLNVLAFEKASGCASTSFFAARNRFDEHGSLLDVSYDIRGARMRGLLTQLRDGGCEIGLHASYRAFEARESFVGERRLLQEVSKTNVKGIRHHFWHTGADVEETLTNHEKAGFAYDSSLAFNEHLGFRRSVAWPYYPWSKKLGRKLKTLQLPMFCMDGNLFYRSVSVDVAVKEIAAMVQTIKDVGGVGVIDWHSDTSSPVTPGYREWGEAYAKVVELLTTDSEIWTTNLQTIADWHADRSRLLSS